MGTFAEILSTLAEGWTILTVASGNGDEGGPAKILMSKDGRFRSLEIRSGIFHPVIGGLQESSDGQSFTYKFLDHMLESIQAHVSGWGNMSILESIDDPMTRRLGFRCQKTGREWWVGLSAIKGHSLMHTFSTQKGREEWARCLSV